LRGSAPGRPETLYSANDIACALTTRPTLKDAYSLTKSLTKINRRRFNLCLQFKKKKNIKFIWTNHGVAYLSDSEGGKAMAIKTEDDLVKNGIVKS